MGDLTRNFDKKDYECKDLCNSCTPDPELVEAVQALRDWLDEPIIINSGCRCAKHNAETPGSDPNSSHMPGRDGFCHAADLRCLDGFYRDRLLEAIYATGRFPRKEICPGWVHVSTDQTKPPDFCNVKGNFK